MTLAPPPADYDGTPARYRLARGTRLWRVHERKYGATAFNPAARDLYRGGRFDASEADPYPFLYAALSDTTAVAESMLRDLDPGDQGMRLVPAGRVTGTRLSGLTVTRDLCLVSLIAGADLAAIGQDAWLVTARQTEYAYTRDWACWLRGQAPWAHGLAWDSLRDRGSVAVILFGDRLASGPGADAVGFAGCAKPVLIEEPQLAVDLDDDAAGTAWLNERLCRYRAVVDPSPEIRSPAVR